MQQLELADGGTLVYRDDGRGPVVVLVHGLGASHTDWCFQVPALASHYRVITPDLPGFGDSPPPKRPLQIDDYAAVIEALVDAVSPDAPVAIVGHSMGGAVSLQAVLRAPSRYRKLVVANSLPSFQPETLRELLEVAYRRLVMRVLGPARLARLSAHRMFPRPDQAALRESIIARGRRNRRQTYLQALSALTRWNALPRLPALQTPTLLIGAEHDYFDADRVEQYAAALPNGRLHWFAGCRHGLPMEAPEAFNAVLLAFLDA